MAEYLILRTLESDIALTYLECAHTPSIARRRVLEKKIEDLEKKKAAIEAMPSIKNLGDISMIHEISAAVKTAKEKCEEESNDEQGSDQQGNSSPKN